MDILKIIYDNGNGLKKFHKNNKFVIQFFAEFFFYKQDVADSM